jgi:hypothetical protein
MVKQIITEGSNLNLSKHKVITTEVYWITNTTTTNINLSKGISMRSESKKSFIWGIQKFNILFKQRFLK